MGSQTFRAPGSSYRKTDRSGSGQMVLPSNMNPPSTSESSIRILPPSQADQASSSQSPTPRVNSAKRVEWDLTAYPSGSQTDRASHRSATAMSSSSSYKTGVLNSRKSVKPAIRMTNGLEDVGSGSAPGIHAGYSFSYVPSRSVEDPDRPMARYVPSFQRRMRLLSPAGFPISPQAQQGNTGPPTVSSSASFFLPPRLKEKERINSGRIRSRIAAMTTREIIAGLISKRGRAELAEQVRRGDLVSQRGSRKKKPLVFHPPSPPEEVSDVENYEEETFSANPESDIPKVPLLTGSPSMHKGCFRMSM